MPNFNFADEKHNYFTYRDKDTKEISFPLGGIGTGSIGLGGNGRLIDWEIFNRPNKNSYNGFSFFAIKAEQGEQVMMSKVLQGDLPPGYSGHGKGVFHGYGFGPPRETLAGLPHYGETSFTGQYPIATMQFYDAGDPIEVRMKAFNPYIPLNEDDSSIPAAIFSFEVTNLTTETINVSLAGCLSNPFIEQSFNQYQVQNSMKSIRLSSMLPKLESPEYGDLSISTDSEHTSHQTYWYRGGWFDNLIVFWKDFTAAGKLVNREYDEPRTLNSATLHEVHNDTAALCSHKTLQPGESVTFRYTITWNYPNYINYWNPPSNGPAPVWKNYYSTLFRDSVNSAAYIFSHFDRLYNQTESFRKAMFNSTLPTEVLDAVSSNLSILKSPTVLRLPDGTLYGFEGNHSNAGSCEGSCSHVWGYEQVTPFLFPRLARSMRELEYKYAQLDNGQMPFRIMLPPERTITEALEDSNKGRPAADGQMVGIIRTYREWIISGDTAWLRSVWPNVVKAMTFAWEPDNAYGWDRDMDGVMEGIQHHTLDVDMIGPNPFISGIYHTALLSASRMAAALGDMEFAETCSKLYDKGSRWVNDNLFNGEYFFQQIDLLNDQYADKELGEIKYQIGNGCHIDQVIGQWHAHLIGIGRVFDPEKTRSALLAVYQHNFIPMLRKYANFCRIYGLNDEQGLLICTWPQGDSPMVPVPYADECMNGFEYQAACHMIYEGLIDEGLQIVKAIRSRYDGERRNPWNEFECGSNYVRSMASYSLLLALSGFRYNMVEGSIGFSPVHVAASDTSIYRCFWSLHTGWGEYVQQSERIELNVSYGSLTIGQFSSSELHITPAAKVSVGDRDIPFEQHEDVLTFNTPISITVEAPLVVIR